MSRFSHRLAQADDVAAIAELMALAIADNMSEFLSAAEVAAARESMGVDLTLIEDQSYFLIETGQDGKKILVGCGGWGKRRTLYGGDHTAGRDDSFSDPTHEAARIRAMYTHPSWIRQGIGSLLLELGEKAARDAGFTTIELGSTIPGEPLYLARGYREVTRDTKIAANGARNTIITMRKDL